METLNPLRQNYIQIIYDYEVENLIHVSIEHFALTLIAGIRMDFISAPEYKKIFGNSKPIPLSLDVKTHLYKRAQEFLYPKLLPKAKELISSVLNKSLIIFTDEQLKSKSLSLTDKIKKGFHPRWDRLRDIFRNHTCTFNELKEESHVHIDQVTFHNVLCEAMSKYRDTGELSKYMEGTNNS